MTRLKRKPNTQPQETFDLPLKEARRYKARGGNLTDLPCIPFEQYYRHRIETIRSLAEWHTRNPGFKGMADNLKRLIDRFPDEMGMMEG